MARSPPEMTAVSKPNKNPPKAAVMEMKKTYRLEFMVIYENGIHETNEKPLILKSIEKICCTSILSIGNLDSFLRKKYYLI